MNAWCYTFLKFAQRLFLIVAACSRLHGWTWVSSQILMVLGLLLQMIKWWKNFANFGIIANHFRILVLLNVDIGNSCYRVENSGVKAQLFEIFSHKISWNLPTITAKRHDSELTSNVALNKLSENVKLAKPIPI